MTLTALLAEKRPAILERWLELTIATYPSDARRFLREEKDRFANPVGRTLAQEMETVFDEVVGGGDVARLEAALAEIIKIRAVQDFSPSRAVGIIFLLKRALREEMKLQAEAGEALRQLAELETKIDKVALLGFDLFMEMREKIADLRVKEIEARYRFLDRRLMMGGEE